MVTKKIKKRGKREGKRGKEKKKRGKRKKRRKENTYDHMAHPILSWGNKNCVTRSYVGGMGVNLGGTEGHNINVSLSILLS